MYHLFSECLDLPKTHFLLKSWKLSKNLRNVWSKFCQRYLAILCENLPTNPGLYVRTFKYPEYAIFLTLLNTISPNDNDSWVIIVNSIMKFCTVCTFSFHFYHLRRSKRIPTLFIVNIKSNIITFLIFGILLPLWLWRVWFRLVRIGIGRLIAINRVGTGEYLQGGGVVRNFKTRV